MAAKTSIKRKHTTPTAQDEAFMRRAIELSERAAIKEMTGGVFGCVIVKDGKIIGEGYNQVAKTNDPTWHAEMQAIREACKKLGTPHLEGCTMYTSSESCPMCLAAAYWAHIDRMFFGAKIEDAVKYGNFDDAAIFEAIRKDPEDRDIEAIPCLREEAVVVWKEFAKMPDRVHY